MHDDWEDLLKHRLLVLLPGLFFVCSVIRLRRKEEVEVEAEVQHGGGCNNSMYSGSLNGNGNRELHGGGSDRSMVPRKEMEDALRAKEDALRGKEEMANALRAKEKELAELRQMVNHKGAHPCDL